MVSGCKNKDDDSLDLPLGGRYNTNEIYLLDGDKLIDLHGIKLKVPHDPGYVDIQVVSAGLIGVYYNYYWTKNESGNTDIYPHKYQESDSRDPELRYDYYDRPPRKYYRIRQTVRIYHVGEYRTEMLYFVSRLTNDEDNFDYAEVIVKYE